MPPPLSAAPSSCHSSDTSAQVHPRDVGMGGNTVVSLDLTGNALLTDMGEPVSYQGTVRPALSRNLLL
jgi:hypothetical protein